MSAEGRTARALALVQKVVTIAVSRRAQPDLARARLPLADRAAVGALHLTSLFATQLARAPFPTATPTENVVMAGMANELRRLAGTILPADSERARDRETVEGALGEAIEAALRLVDAAMGAPPPPQVTSSRNDARIQIAALGEASEASVAPGEDGAADDS